MSFGKSVPNNMVGPNQQLLMSNNLQGQGLQEGQFQNMGGMNNMNIQGGHNGY